MLLPSPEPIVTNGEEGHESLSMHLRVERQGKFGKGNQGVGTGAPDIDQGKPECALSSFPLKSGEVKFVHFWPEDILISSYN